MDLSKIYPPRPAWVHKGNYGRVLVICGSTLYSGSATLASIAAVRAGADLVTVCAPEKAANVASYTMPDLMVFPLKGDSLSSSHTSDILDVAHIRRINSVVLGCGLGRKQSTFAAIYKLISKLMVPLVLDADALRALAQNPGIISRKHAVLTPHAGELAVLLAKKAGEGQIGDSFEDRLSAAKEAADKFHSIVLLKGHVDIVTDGVSTITNNSGSPYMTKGGFGDTLSGILGAILARGVGLFEAAHAAAYINGRAGELATAAYGEGVAASDIFRYIPTVVSGA